MTVYRIHGNFKEILIPFAIWPGNRVLELPLKKSEDYYGKRTCKLCNNVAQDEIHILLKCPVLDSISKDFKLYHKHEAWKLK